MNANDITNFLNNNRQFTIDDIVMEVSRDDMRLMITQTWGKYNGETYVKYYCREGIINVQIGNTSRIISKRQKQFEDEMYEIINVST